jgi:hypothetical protein
MRKGWKRNEWTTTEVRILRRLAGARRRLRWGSYTRGEDEEVLGLLGRHSAGSVRVVLHNIRRKMREGMDG